MPRIIKTVQLQPKPERLLNVAAYARVSSGKDAMIKSTHSKALPTFIRVYFFKISAKMSVPPEDA